MKGDIEIREHEGGRISFPGVVEYRVRGRFGAETLPYPPTATSHPAPTRPVPLSSFTTAKMIALGEIKPLPSSLPFQIVVLDLAAYNRLAASGLLYDPRHSGSRPAPAIDNRPAPGA